MNQEKKVLIIGSSVADVIIDVERLPRSGEDVHIIDQRVSEAVPLTYPISSGISRYRICCSPRPAPGFTAILSGRNGRSVGSHRPFRSQIPQTAVVTVL